MREATQPRWPLDLFHLSRDRLVLELHQPRPIHDRIIQWDDAICLISVLSCHVRLLPDPG